MIYVMRHGKTDWNARYKMQGTTDIPLNEEGRQMAVDAAEKYKDMQFDVCYCSPLSRAVETAELFLKGKDTPIIVDNRLIEMGFGEYEGTERAYETPENPINVLFKDPEHYVPDRGAESFEELYARTAEFIREVAVPASEEGKNVLLVGHGALFCSIFCSEMNIPRKFFWDQLIKNCQLIQLGKRPVIGMTTEFHEAKDRFNITEDYMNFALEAGALPIALPVTTDEKVMEQYVDMCDGILFTGGLDFGPEILGVEPINDTVVASPERDAMEFPLFRIAMKKDKPILGICRGMQLISTAMGNPMIQDIPAEAPSDVNHGQAPRSRELVHSVNIVEGTPLSAVIGKPSMQVNSMHHQAVILGNAPAVKPMAYAEDGIVEAIYVEGARFIRGYQWHPECIRNIDGDNRKVLMDFIRNCR